MPRNEANANYAIVKEWLAKTKAIVPRKLYSINELHTFFTTEVDYNYSTSIRSFTIAISKCIKASNNIKKMKISTRVFWFGIFPNNNSSCLHHHIRRSQRNRKGKIIPHPLGKIVKSTVPEIDSQSCIHSESNSNSEPEPVTVPLKSDVIANMSKMDLPMALSFFSGKERAKEIIKSNQSETPMKYGSIICQHITNQIKKLKSAQLSFSGWQQIIDDCDVMNECSQYQIFYLRIKASYLWKLYSFLLHYYDTIENVSDIASLAILAVNKANKLLDDNDDRNHRITNPKTLLTWF